MDSSNERNGNMALHTFGPEIPLEFYDYMSIEHDNEACMTEPSGDDRIFRLAHSFPTDVAKLLLLILNPYDPEIQPEIELGLKNCLSSDQKEFFQEIWKDLGSNFQERLHSINNKYVVGNVLTQCAKRDPELIIWMDDIFVVTLWNKIILSRVFSADEGIDTTGNGINELAIAIWTPPHLKGRVPMP